MMACREGGNSRAKGKKARVVRREKWHARNKNGGGCGNTLPPAAVKNLAGVKRLWRKYCNAPSVAAHG
ncbi:hypothetical protein PSP6_690080 [Paraburkholderia tropica]|nr:hypothetical protein PSP6_690080 [Paraburkholderia tropica]